MPPSVFAVSGRAFIERADERLEAVLSARLRALEAALEQVKADAISAAPRGRPRKRPASILPEGTPVKAGALDTVEKLALPLISAPVLSQDSASVLPQTSAPVVSPVKIAVLSPVKPPVVAQTVAPVLARRRGRPRKADTVAAQVSAANVENEMPAASQSAEPVSSQSSADTTLNSHAKSAVAVATVAPTSDSSQLSDFVNPPKRRAVRNVKILSDDAAKETAAVPSAPAVSNSVAVDASVDAEAAPKPKGRRGRKPKAPTADESMLAETPGASTVKQRRVTRQTVSKAAESAVDTAEDAPLSLSFDLDSGLMSLASAAASPEANVDPVHESAQPQFQPSAAAGDEPSAPSVPTSPVALANEVPKPGVLEKSPTDRAARPAASDVHYGRVSGPVATVDDAIFDFLNAPAATAAQAAAPAVPPAAPVFAPKAEESPLSRAKRLDAENTWRERQLQEYSRMKDVRLRSMHAPSVPSTLASALSAGDVTRTTSVTSTSSNSSSSSAALPAVRAPSTVSGPPSLVQSAVSIADEPMPAAMDLVQTFDVEKPADQQPAIAPVQQSPAVPTVPIFSVSAEPSGDGRQTAKIATAEDEEERRRRVKERNEKAVEKRIGLLQKAQQAKAELTGKAGTSSASVTAAQVRASFFSTAAAPGAAGAKAAPVLHVDGASIFGAQPKAAVPAAAIVASAQPAESTPVKDAGGFHLPLPKSRTPARPGAQHGARAASPSPSGSPPQTPAAAAAPDADATPPVPVLASDSLRVCAPPAASSSAASSAAAGASGENVPGANRPAWAHTPTVTRMLHVQQRVMKPEDIFGPIEPVRLEDFFRSTGKTYPRGRNSGIFPK